MSGIWTEEDLRTTIQFEEIDVDDTGVGPTTSDLLSALPDDPAIETEERDRRLHPGRASAPTISQENWDMMPAHERLKPERVYEEVTAVREDPRRVEKTQWIDVHAVVDRNGRLTLPGKLAERLAPGSVVEIRIGRWALPEK
jgi:hypothetical protein